MVRLKWSELHREVVSDPSVELQPTWRQWGVPGLGCAPMAPAQVQESEKMICCWKTTITWDLSSLRMNPMFQKPGVESPVRERRQRAGRFSLQGSICTGRFWEYRECQRALWQSESRCCLKHKTDSSTWTTERGRHGSGLYSSSGRSWRYWAPEWKLVGPRRWEWIHVWARKQSCRGLQNTIEPFWERRPFPALIVLV